MNPKIAIIPVLLLFASKANSQDPDLFFATRAASLIDPSRTGAASGTQLSFIDRTQWQRLDRPFRTQLLALEHGSRGRSEHSLRPGFGLFLLNDKAGPLGYRRTAIAPRSAIHLPVSANGTLSFGMSAELDQWILGDVQGQWASQYDGGQYDPGIAAGENFQAGTMTTLGLGTGLSYSAMTEAGPQKRSRTPWLVIGASAARLAQIQLGSSANGLAMPTVRYSAHAAVSAPVASRLFERIFFESVYHRMEPHTTLRVNLAVGNPPFQGARISDRTRSVGYRFGIGYRYRDAILVNASLELLGLSVGLAYGWAPYTEDRLVAGARTAELFLQYRLNGRR